MMRSKLSEYLLVASLAVGCSGDPGDAGGVDVSSRNPRCVSACPETMPPYPGAGEICDAASREQCLDECEARIAGLAPICQNCLVEEACFGPDGCYGDEVSGSCTNTTNSCTLTSQYGTCTFSIGDEAGKIKCFQQVDPRREVSCTPSFRSATECASVCT